MKFRPDFAAYLVGCAAGLAGLIAFGFVEAWLVRYIGANDFASIWTGPRALALGLDPYDPATWPATVRAIQGPFQLAAYTVYTYPGYVAVALLPLGLLPLPVAAVTWAIGGMCAAAIALRVLARELIASPASHALLGLTLFLSQPAILTFYDGQWGFVFVAALALCVHALRHGAQMPAGLAAAVLLAKPTLFLLAIPALGAAALAFGMRRAIVIFVAVAVSLVAISLVLLPGWPVPYAAYAASPRLGSARVTTLPVAMGDLLGPIGGVLAFALIAAGLALALRTRPGQQRFLAPWLALSVGIAPYAWSYDLLVLIVPLALIGGTRRGDRALAFGAAVLLLVATLLHGMTAEARQSESFVALAGAVVVAIVVFETVWHPRAAVARA